jgi:hypothetical protein
VQISAPSELLTLSLQGGIADVRLNRPEKLNALMFDALTIEPWTVNN